MLLEWFWRLWAGWGRSERRVGIPFPWGMRLGLILAEWRTAEAGDPENQPGTLAFTHCLPAGHPQHQSDGFRFSSLEGEGRDRTDIVTAWLKTFPFDVLFFLRGGGEGQDSCRFFLCWHRDPRVGSLPFPPCFVLCLWLELGTSPWRDRTGTVLCSPAPGSPGLCRDSHSTSTFLSLSFPSFSPFLSLLSPHLPSTPPTLPMGCTRWHFTGRPPPKPQICTVFYFPEQQKKKGAECCLELEQVTKTFQKPSKYISFSVPRAPAAPWAERKGSCSARGGDSRSPSGQEPSGFCLFP